MLNLYFSSKTKSYYCVDPIKCTNCTNNIENVFLLVYFFDKKESWVSHFCKNCFEKFKNHSTIVNYVLVLVENPPHDAIRSYPNPPATRALSDVSVYDIAKIDEQFKPLVTKDRTVYAGRESIEGAQIGNLDYLKEKRKQIPQELRGLE